MGITRDFTQEKYERMVNQISEMEDEDGLGEAIGDFLIRGAHFIGILNVENQTSDTLDRYHRRLLDGYNTKKSELTEIFDDVAGVDADYKTKFSSLAETADTCRRLLDILTGAINPSSGTLTTDRITSKCGELGKKLSGQMEQAATMYDAELSYAEKHLRDEAWKEAGADLLGFGGGVLGFVVDFASGKGTDAANDLWKVCNSFIGLGQDLEALTDLGCGWLVNKVAVMNGNDEYGRRSRRDYLESAKKNKEQSGVTDELKEAFGDVDYMNLDDNHVVGALDFMGLLMYKTSENLDFASDVYGAGKAVMGFGRWVTDIGNEDVEFGEYLFGRLKDLTGFDLGPVPEGVIPPGGDKDWLRIAKQSKQAFGLLKQGYEFLIAASEEDKSIGGQVFKNTAFGSVISKGKGVWDDYLYPFKEDVAEPFWKYYLKPRMRAITEPLVL